VLSKELSLLDKNTRNDRPGCRVPFFFVIIIIVLLDCLEINKNEEVKNSCLFEILILQDLI
jgi:hypothetical protein